MRLSNNQVVGYVLISRETNPELRDQTNREGLIENQAYDDLRDAGAGGSCSSSKPSGTASGPGRSKPEPHPADCLPASTSRPSAPTRTRRTRATSRLAGLLGEAQENLDHGIERAQEVVARYRRLATLGELIDKVLHDGRAPLAKIGSDAQLALRDIVQK